MRFAHAVVFAFVSLALACGGSTYGDVLPGSDDGSCGANACGACQDGFVNRDTCSGGSWKCSCVPREGGVRQCTAAPACAPGDQEIEVGAVCPPRATCYAQTTCGATIQCASMPDQCKAIPVCDLGDEEVGPPACATGGGCYQRAACGISILCSRASVWPTDAIKLVATDDGGGFVPTPPPGSACKDGEAQFTFTVANGMVSFKTCNTNVTPYAFKTGTLVLSPTDAQAVKAAAAGLKVATKTSCGNDKSQLTVDVTAASSGTKKYYDSFYSCLGQGVYVDGMDALFGKLRSLTNP